MSYSFSIPATPGTELVEALNGAAEGNASLHGGSQIASAIAVVGDLVASGYWGDPATYQFSATVQGHACNPAGNPAEGETADWLQIVISNAGPVAALDPTPVTEPPQPEPPVEVPADGTPEPAPQPEPDPTAVAEPAPPAEEPAPEPLNPTVAEGNEAAPFDPAASGTPTEAGSIKG